MKHKIQPYGYHNYEKAKRVTGINNLTQEDVFVVSYPKSGNTWVRFIIANLLSQGEEISFRNIDQYVPDDEKSLEQINSREGKRFIKSHSQHFKYFPKFIYIIRDGRDVLVSYYFYLVARKRFEGSFQEFLRSESIATYGPWHEHVYNALSLYYHGDNKILLLKYENMLANPYEAVKKIADFCDIETNEASVEKVIQKCSFDSLKENEAKFGSELSGANGGFFRNGKSGNWRDHFSEDDHGLFLWEASDMLIKNGYDPRY